MNFETAQEKKKMKKKRFFQQPFQFCTEKFFRIREKGKRQQDMLPHQEGSIFQ